MSSEILQLLQFRRALFIFCFRAENKTQSCAHHPRAGVAWVTFTTKAAYGVRALCVGVTTICILLAFVNICRKSAYFRQAVLRQ